MTTTLTLQRPDVRRRMVAARTGLLLGEPFFGPLSLRLDLHEDPACDTAWVDGARLGYNPTFVDTLSDRELETLIIHEVMHCANGHPWRREARDHKRWNEACDRVINPLLREAGWPLPKGGLVELDPSHLGRSAEWVYGRLPTPPESAQGSSGNSSGNSGTTPGNAGSTSPTAGEPGEGAPNPLGEVRDAPSETAGTEDGTPSTESAPSEADWQRAVQQAAAMARAQGRLPGALDRFAETATKPRVDWKAALRRFVQDRASADYSYARPNARYVVHGLILPALRSEELGVLAVAIDTSGSVDAVLLAQFAAELQAIVDEVRPRQVRVLYADARVHREDVFERNEPITLNPVGGGGTDFRPVFETIARWDDMPVAVVYLTDLYGTFPTVSPDIETVWVTPTQSPPPVPFGDVIIAT